MTAPAPIWIPQSIALVDLSCVWKKNFLSSPGGDPRAATDRTLSELSAVRESVEHVILCLDTPPYERRLAIYPQYKATREPMSDVEKAQKRWLIGECKRLGYQIARVKGEEADDVIATLAKAYGEICADVRLVGADKDLAQCVTDNVRQMVPAVGERPAELRGPARVLEKYGVTPHQIPMWLALVGDRGDNVPGVPGIGQVKAVQLIAEHRTHYDLGQAAMLRAPSGVWKALKENWSNFEMSMALVMLKSNLPIDSNALLVPLDPAPLEETGAGLDEALEPERGSDAYDQAYAESEHLDPLPNGRPTPIIGKDPKADEVLRKLAAERATRGDYRAPDTAAHQAEQETEEQWRKEMREENEAAERDYDKAVNPPANDQKPAESGTRPAVTEAEFDPIGKSPAANGPMPPRPAPEKKDVLVKAPPDYGVVTADLQPQDLRSANVISKWLHASNLYPQFRGEAAIFAVIMRGKELGLGVTTALAGFHVVEGKPTASADLIRSLATRSEKCKYFRLIHSDDTYAEWETWHADHPEPTRYKYTIEEAIEAGLNSGNWKKRKRDMLTKTAAVKLARICYAGDVLGLYAAEEFNDAYGEAA
jgi:5'-3' exonuclease